MTPPNTPLHKYPHLMGTDIIIWDRYIRLHGHLYDKFEYDVHVGEGILPSSDLPTPFDAMAIHLTQKRIDVVAYQPNMITIIEVKLRPTLAAIGQILGYTELYKRDFTPNLPLSSMLIAETIDPDISFICQKLSINCHQVLNKKEYDELTNTRITGPTSPTL